jgi:SAM-dependent methyltransferase
MELTPWYRRWFGEAYKKLYPHRDDAQADSQVASLLRILPVTSAWRILDVGCGQGRHLEVFRQRGLNAVGIDLSASLLRDAAGKKLAVARGDMRHLPCKRGGFDLVTSFFTSFGYFATFEEDVEALAQLASVLKPGGYLFLDLLNKAHLVNTLVATDRKTVGGAEVVQHRRIEGSVVIKEIEIHRGAGGSASVERHEERVRLYGPGELTVPAARLGLSETRVFGDECCGRYNSDRSPRMSLLFKKTG